MVIAWFSCGATSAIACKLALQMYKDVRIVYIETGSAHPDNKRFISDCERWYNQQIEIIRSKEYNSVDDVIIRKKYINGAQGAACTFLLKKKVRYKFEDEIRKWDAQVFGFDFCKHEINRAIRFRQQNKSTKPIFPLIEKQISKENTLEMLLKANIEIPAMYRLGYNNNNCIGCVKGGVGYWNKIRVDFPDRFRQMAVIERKVNATCIHDKNGKIWLDELKQDRGKHVKALLPDCSLFCQIEFENIIDAQTYKVLSGRLNINKTI